MEPTNIDLFRKKNTISLNCVKFLKEKYKVKKKKRKTRPKNNVKHDMNWVEKMNTKFKKQKMSLENESKPPPPLPPNT